MIITLQNADFSANNIGQISIPVVFNEFTRKIFSKCTRYELGSPQSKAVNKFVNVLKNLGILGHLSFFNAPCLSATKEQALYDFINEYELDGTNFTFSNGVISGVDYKVTDLRVNIPLQNIIGVVSDKATWQKDIVFRGDKACAMFGNSSAAILGDSFNFNRGLSLYGLQDTSKLLVVKADTITENDKDKVFINGKQSTIVSGTSGLMVSGSYNKYGVYNNDAQTIAFACDGSVTLTDNDTVLLVNAMLDLEAALFDNTEI